MVNQQIRVIEVDTLLDAGARGWGGVLYLPPGSHAASASLLLAAGRSLPDNMTLEAIHSVFHDGIRVCGTFSSSEMAECSNVRELLANLRTTESPLKHYSGSSLMCGLTVA